ncbi:MAG: response regulator [Sphingobacteriales bacterium]|nr:MAG: response regulator [Sphingobacteriales bacterium]
MNKQIDAIIVDDEQDGREVLQHLLSLHAHSIMVVVGWAISADEACKLIEELKPALVFLDIQMAGKSGFKVLSQYKEINFEVIFVTSYDQYALTAIRFNALDYLLKPIAIDELKAATEKAIKRIHAEVDDEQRIKLIRKFRLEEGS